MLNGNDWRYYILCISVRSYHIKQIVFALSLLQNNSPPTHLIFFHDHHVNLLPQYSVSSIILIYNFAVLVTTIMCKNVCLTYCSSQPLTCMETVIDTDLHIGSSEIQICQRKNTTKIRGYTQSCVVIIRYLMLLMKIEKRWCKLV